MKRRHLHAARRRRRSAFSALRRQAQDIKLGFNGDLSASPSALSGQAAVLGMQAAIDDVNAAGGVLGEKLTLVIRDDLSQPPKSIQNMSDLIDNEKVVGRVRPDQLRQRAWPGSTSPTRRRFRSSATSARAPTSPSR